MKYAVIRGETYTGAIYTDLTQDMIDHHTNQNEWFHPVTDRFIMKIDPDTRQVVDVPSITKKNALDYVLDVIDRKYKDVSYPVFTYIHVFSEVPEEIVSYPIHNDLVTIQGQFIALSLLDPVSTITWKTAQKESDGITNVYIIIISQNLGISNGKRSLFCCGKARIVSCHRSIIGSSDGNNNIMLSVVY